MENRKTGSNPLKSFEMYLLVAILCLIVIAGVGYADPSSLIAASVAFGALCVVMTLIKGLGAIHETFKNNMRELGKALGEISEEIRELKENK